MYFLDPPRKRVDSHSSSSPHFQTQRARCCKSAKFPRFRVQHTLLPPSSLLPPPSSLLPPPSSGHIPLALQILTNSPLAPLGSASRLLPITPPQQGATTHTTAALLLLLPRAARPAMPGVNSPLRSNPCQSQGPLGRGNCPRP